MKKRLNIEMLTEEYYTLESIGATPDMNDPHMYEIRPCCINTKYISAVIPFQGRNDRVNIYMSSGDVFVAQGSYDGISKELGW